LFGESEQTRQALRVPEAIGRMPVVLEGGVPEALFWLCLGGWLLGEVAFAARTTLRDPATRDSSFTLLTLALVGGLGAGVWIAAESESSLPGPDWWPPLAGLALFAGGLGLRVWAIRALGRFFRYTVVVDADQRVIDTGPYRLIRHPSYTGLLLAALGVGVALDNWLSIAACLLPPVLGFTLRLRHEEAVLSERLGEPYRAYMRRTRRLIPHVW
jgi:protein-S-isoprenylcysteine O-methyltransferase Ste14